MVENKFNIHMTESARNHLQLMLAKQQGCVFRLSIKKTGCSGYSYIPEIIPTCHANDLQVNILGLPIFIDQKWAAFFANMTIDFVEDTKSGVKQKKLVFINQNESSRCGCGESFHLASEENHRA